MLPLYGALPIPYVPVWVTCSAVLAHRDTYEPPHCRTSQQCRTFISLCVSVVDLADPVFDGMGLVGFKSRTNTFLLVSAATVVT